MSQLTEVAYYLTLWMPQKPVLYWNQALMGWISDKALATRYPAKLSALHRLKVLRRREPAIRPFTEVSLLSSS